MKKTHLIISRRKLVLASSSPRRKDILSGAFSEFVIDPPKKAEKPLAELGDPRHAVVTLAKDKAKEVAERHENALVIGCDTCVWIDQFLGKPTNREDARRMLTLLSGKSHSVFSGVCVIDTQTSETKLAVEETKVFFDTISDEEMEFLLASEEYVSKAGAYAIQGLTSLFIRSIEGDYYNVVGLPLHTLYGMLKEMGI